MKKIEKRARITGELREKIGAELRKKYEKGASIRQLVDKTGRSYGFVRRILLDSGATLRRRGGGARKVGPKGQPK